MKNIIAVFVFCLINIPITLQAGETFASASLFNEYRTNPNRYVPILNLYVSAPVHENIDFFSFASANKGAGFSYSGFMLKPNSWLALGAGAGLSSATSGLIVSPQIKIAYKKFFWLSLGEFEKNAHFYFSSMTYQAHEHVKIGILLKQYSGLGPQVSIAIPETKISLTAAPLYDCENQSFTAFTSTSFVF